LQIFGIHQQSFDLARGDGVLGALCERTGGFNGQVIDHRGHVLLAFGQALSALFLGGRADLARQEHHAVVAGDIDVRCIAEVLAQTLCRAQLDAFVFQLNAGSAAVNGHHATHHCAAHHQRRTG